MIDNNWYDYTYVTLTGGQSAATTAIWDDTGAVIIPAGASADWRQLTMSWTNWVEQNNATQVHNIQTQWLTAPTRSRAYRPTVEQLEREVAERALVAERARQAEAGRIAARDRAKALLLSLLTEAQRLQYLAENFFDVRAKSGRRYRIHKGTHGNVFAMNEAGERLTRYCGQPNGIPDEDAMLAQKLMIEIHEEDYLRAANATPLR